VLHITCYTRSFEGIQHKTHMSLATAARASNATFQGVRTRELRRQTECAVSMSNTVSLQPWQSFVQLQCLGQLQGGTCGLPLLAAAGWPRSCKCLWGASQVGPPCAPTRVLQSSALHKNACYRRGAWCKTVLHWSAMRQPSDYVLNNICDSWDNKHVLVHDWTS